MGLISQSTEWESSHLRDSCVGTAILEHTMTFFNTHASAAMFIDLLFVETVCIVGGNGEKFLERAIDNSVRVVSW